MSIQLFDMKNIMLMIYSQTQTNLFIPRFVDENIKHQKQRGLVFKLEFSYYEGFEDMSRTQSFLKALYVLILSSIKLNC